MKKNIIIPMNNYCLTLHKMKVNSYKLKKDKFVNFKNILNSMESNEILNNKNIFCVEVI